MYHIMSSNHVILYFVLSDPASCCEASYIKKKFLPLIYYNVESENTERYSDLTTAYTYNFLACRQMATLFVVATVNTERKNTKAYSNAIHRSLSGHLFL